jgi:S1-C subfamily serine protease
MLGADGKLLGIGSLRLQMIQNGAVADINMVVPIDLLPPILDDLVTRGSVDRPPRPWLGVFTAESDGDVVVMNVSDNSPADQAGLQRGDIISDIRDQQISGLADFYRKVWGTGPAGAEVAMRIVRDGRDTWVRVKSADRNTYLRRPHLQ